MNERDSFANIIIISLPGTQIFTTKTEVQEITETATKVQTYSKSNLIASIIN